MAGTLSARRAGPLVAIAVVVLAFCAPMFSVPEGIASGDPFRDNDWLNCRSFDLLSRVALLEHGQFPLRSAQVGGGFPTIAHPSDGSTAPTLVAVLLFGDVLGVKINLLIGLMLGSLGVLRLARGWLGLSSAASLFCALLFAVSGWLPSILLVGDYQKAMYLAAPWALLFLLEARRRPDSGLLAALPLALVLQQGGFAFPAVVFFLAVSTLFAATDEEDGTGGVRRFLEMAVLGVLLVAPLGGLWDEEPSVLPLVVGWGAAGVWATRSTRGRALVRCARPWLLQLGVALLVACSLGATRIVGLAYLGQHGGSYSHGPEQIEVPLLAAEAPGDVVEGLDGPGPDEFYGSPAQVLRGLAGRVPAGRVGEPVDRGNPNRTEAEHGWMGLSWVILPLALLGVALPGRRRLWLTASTLLVVGLCLGPGLPVDLHQLLTGGLPFLRSVGQPLKYFGFFLLLTTVLLAGAGLDRVLARTPVDWVPWVRAGAFLLLLVPFLQNRAVWSELFAEPVSVEVAEEFGQGLQVTDSASTELPLAALRRRSDALGLREYARPAAATEYPAILAGVGVIDWYGTVVLPEHAIPNWFVLGDGTRVPNPNDRGDAWVPGGLGTVESVRMRPNTIEVSVTTTGPATVVVNQSWLRGFVAEQAVEAVGPDGEPQPGGGLLGVRVPTAGHHALTLRYRPTWLLAGLGWSALSLLAWCVIAIRFRGRHD